MWVGYQQVNGPPRALPSVFGLLKADPQPSLFPFREAVVPFGAAASLQSFVNDYIAFHAFPGRMNSNLYRNYFLYKNGLCVFLVADSVAVVAISRNP